MPVPVEDPRMELKPNVPEMTIAGGDGHVGGGSGPSNEGSESPEGAEKPEGAEEAEGPSKPGFTDSDGNKHEFDSHLEMVKSPEGQKHMASFGHGALSRNIMMPMIAKGYDLKANFASKVAHFGEEAQKTPAEQNNRNMEFEKRTAIPQIRGPHRL